MSKRSGEKITMPSLDELLCVPEIEGTIDLDVDAIYPFENHPFKVLDDERMEELIESIQENGVLTPVLVRPDDEGTYEMISGHRRLRAAKRVGLRKIPAIIKELTDDEATIAMVDGNIQREEILPSEKAFAYRMKLEAIKRQGKRGDLTSPQNGGKSTGSGRRKEAADLVGESMGTSGTQVQRIVRLTELITPLLNLVDEKRLSLMVAVELSYFNKNVQQWLYEYIKENGMIKQEQLRELREYRNDEKMTQEKLISILIKSRATLEKRKKVTLSSRKLNNFFPAYYSQSEMEKVILTLLQQWKLDQEENAK